MENGRNVIREWIDDQPVLAQAAIDVFIEQLAAMPDLRHPHTKVLTGPYDGMFELRIRTPKVEYRPLACYGPERRQVTILTGAIERGGKITPRSAYATALQRKANIHQEGYTCEHE